MEQKTKSGAALVLRWTATGALWLLTLVATLMMAKAGWGKFQNGPGWVFWFQKWGYPGWFAYGVGVIELVGAALLLVPKLASYSAALLAMVMVGAFLTVTFNESDLSAVDPVINAIILIIVLLGHFRSRWRPSPS